MTEHTRRRRAALGAASLLTFVVGPLACDSDVTDHETVERTSLAATIGGSCSEPTLDFDDLGNWQLVSGMAPTADPLGSPTGPSMRVAAGNHTFRATLNPLTSSWTGNMTVAVRGVTTGVFVSGTINVTVSAPPLQPVTLTRAFNNVVAGSWTTLNLPIPAAATQAALAAQATPVTITLQVQTNQPLRIDALRFGDLVCARCNPPLAAATLPGDEPALPPGTTPTELAVRIPSVLDVGSIALAANGELKVNDRAKVRGLAAGSFAPVTNSGFFETNIGVSATVGNVHSVGPVVLRGGTIAGNLFRQGTYSSQPPATITGTNSQNGIPLKDVRWTAHLPAYQGSSVTYTGGTRTLASNLGSVLMQGGTAVVPTGATSLTSLSIQPGASLVLDNAGGDAFLYAQTLDIKGPITLTNPNRNNGVIVYLGTNDVFFTNSFSGTIVAPNAKVVIDRQGATFTGSVFARSIELHQDGQFTHRPYDPVCQADGIHLCGQSKLGCPTLTGCTAQQCLPGETLEAVTEESCYETAKAPIWGFADLHAHPATELGWGAVDGQGGMFIGSTGFDLAGPFPALTCDPDVHAGTGIDLVKELTRRTLINQTEGPGHFAHTGHGTAGVGSWPSARSVLHQQMRIDWIRRAFDGGLRLMFASVANNRLLSQLWHNGFNLGGNPIFPPENPSNAQWDLEEAEKQFNHIEALVAANSSWMEIVDSPASARAAIRAGKLAIVLSLEMDSLTLAGILELKSRHKVGHVIPIHLADNAWGGTAVYNPAFEGNSWFLNRGTQIQLAHDPKLNFHLPHRTVLKSAGLGAIAPDSQPLTPEEECNPQRDGHKNARGLTANGRLGLERLMQEGMFIDVSHMGDLATADAIRVMTDRKWQYPVMSSHTGIREEVPLDALRKSARAPVIDERAIAKSQVRKIAESGGVIGVGTSGGESERVLADLMGAAVVNVGNPRTPTWEWLLSDRRLWPENTLVKRLRFSAQTSDGNKRWCNELRVRVHLRSNEIFTFTILEGQEIDEYSWVRDIPLDLPRHVPLSDIVQVELDFNSEERCNFWERHADFRILDLKITWEGATEGRGVLVQRTASVRNHPDSVFGGNPYAGYYVKLETGYNRHFERLRWSQDEQFLNEEILRLRVRLRTGEDDLRGNDEKVEATIKIHTTDPCLKAEIPIDQELPNQSDWDGFFHFTDVRRPDGTPFTVADVLGVTLTTPDDCPAFCIDTDNWNVEFAAVEVQTPSGMYELANHRGRPFARITDDRTDVTLYEAPNTCRGLSLQDPAETVLVHLKTGDDRASSLDPLRVRICQNNGTCSETFVNPSAPWSTSGDQENNFLPQNSEVTVAVRLGPGATVRTLESLRIDGATSGWDLDRIRVTIPDDPLEKWNGYYRAAVGVMNGRGVALGTDLNGLQHQLAFSNTSPNYPFSVLGPNGTPAASLGRHTIGDRVLDFEKDGLAHYGMLADMVAALRNLPGGQDTYDRLFRSAEDVVRMWERIEARTQVFAQRRSGPCAAFGMGPDVARTVTGVSCVTLSSELPASWGTSRAMLRIAADPAGMFQGGGIVDVHAISCDGQTHVMSFAALNQWLMTPEVSQSCPLTLRMQSEPDVNFDLVYVKQQ